MKKGEFLFVYGTLRKGERADLSRGWCQHDTSYVCQDRINGKLFHLGSFPGLKLLSDAVNFDPKLPVVIGEIYLILNSSVGAVLDAYESYQADYPDKGLYNRSQVLTGTGRLVWVYTYNDRTLEDQLIETGDWRNPRLLLTKRIPKFG